jgi:hypothetical protein
LGDLDHLEPGIGQGDMPGRAIEQAKAHSFSNSRISTLNPDGVMNIDSAARAKFAVLCD